MQNDTDRRKFSVRYRPANEPPRKVSFEPQEADGVWLRRTYRWRCGQWRYEGSELVRDVAIETAAGEVEAHEVEV